MHRPKTATLRAGAVRNGGSAVVQQVRGWFTAPSTEWADVDRFLARDAGQLAKTWHPKRADKKKRLRGADATHLAAAVRLGCDYLMTHDEASRSGTPSTACKSCGPRWCGQSTCRRVSSKAIRAPKDGQEPPDLRDTTSPGRCVFPGQEFMEHDTAVSSQFAIEASPTLAG